jgi:Flp pilus assembly protein TadB
MPKGFFGFLVILMLLSLILSYQGIAKEKRAQIWEWRFPVAGEQERSHGFMGFSERTIIFLDSTAGLITSCTLLIIIPLGCGILAFGFDRLYLGLFTLMACTAFYCWIGFCLWLFDPFVPMIRM